MWTGQLEEVIGAACTLATAYSVAIWYFAPGTNRKSKAKHLPLAPALQGEETNKDPVLRHRCGILQANEQLEWSYWFGWTPKWQVWDACCIMLYDAVGVSSQSWLFIPCVVRVLSIFHFCHAHLDDYITHILLLWQWHTSTFSCKIYKYLLVNCQVQKIRVLELYRQFYRVSIVQHLHHWPPGFVTCRTLHRFSVAPGFASQRCQRLGVAAAFTMVAVFGASCGGQGAGVQHGEGMVRWFKKRGSKSSLEMVLVNHCLILSNVGRWREKYLIWPHGEPLMQFDHIHTPD